MNFEYRKIIAMSFFAVMLSLIAFLDTSQTQTSQITNVTNITNYTNNNFTNITNYYTNNQSISDLQNYSNQNYTNNLNVNNWQNNTFKLESSNYTNYSQQSSPCWITLGTVYQNKNRTSLAISVVTELTAQVYAYTDSSNPPVTIVDMDSASNGIQGVFFIVLPNNFYKVSSVSNSIRYCAIWS